MVFRSLFNPTLLAYRLQCDGGRLGHPCHRSGILARPICRSFAGAAANNFLQDAVWPISTFHVGPDQPDPRPNPNPNNNNNPVPLGGLRSAGADARLRRVFWWRFSRKARAAQNLVSTNQTSDLQEVICRYLLQIGQVVVVGVFAVFVVAVFWRVGQWLCLRWCWSWCWC